MSARRGIIMTGWKVRAILAGEASQTRRVIVPQPTLPYTWATNQVLPDGYALWTDNRMQGEKGQHEHRRCPYGVDGDRLYVKETFAEVGKGRLYYQADNKALPYPYKAVWKSSRFMPARVARIELEIVNAMAERLKDIGDRDAEAEGILTWLDEIGKFNNAYSADALAVSPRYCFLKAWDELNQKRGYASEFNPWVFKIEFKVVSK
jgi:hypothetical protein